MTAAAFFGANGAIVNDNGLTINNANFGFRVPDIIANLRLDQAWGFVGISAALHDASGAYYATPNVVNNGHPEDKYGWALAGGAKFNLPGGDMIGFNVCYSEGAAGFCTNNNFFQLYNNSNQRGAWLDRRRHLQHRHPDRADQGVECSCRVRAHLEPEVADLGRWRLCQRRLQRRPPLTSSTAAAPRCRLGELRRGGARCWSDHSRLHSAPVGNSCSPDYSFWEAGTRTQWNPVPQLDIGLELLYTPHNTAFKGAGGRCQRTARVPPSSTGSSTTRTSVRDVPLAAQLLSMIA